MTYTQFYPSIVAIICDESTRNNRRTCSITWGTDPHSAYIDQFRLINISIPCSCGFRGGLMQDVFPPYQLCHAWDAFRRKPYLFPTTSVYSSPKFFNCKISVFCKKSRKYAMKWFMWFELLLSYKCLMLWWKLFYYNIPFFTPSKNTCVAKIDA